MGGWFKYFFVGAGGRDANDGRAAEGVDFLQFGACAAGFVALEDLDVVFEVELFEEPDDALGAGLLEPAFCGQRLLFLSLRGGLLAVPEGG